MICTFDANFLTSGLIAQPGGTIDAILEAWRVGRFNVALSQHIYDELTRTLAEPYFANRVPAYAIANYLAFVVQQSTFYPIIVTVAGVATHPEDDLVLATALSAGAAYLVTGDRRFRSRVPRYQGVTLVSSAEFLAVIGA